MSKSDYLENELLDHTLGNAAWAAPANVWVALYTVTPNDAGGGVECVGGAYARVALVNNAVNWPAAAAGLKQNGTAIAFPTLTGAWGTIVAWAILDAAVAGNFLYWGPVTPNRTPLVGDTPEFAVGDLDITED